MNTRHPEPGPDFPRVLSVHEESSEYCLQMDITPQLDCFRGHFPGNPVLPGVVQLHWAVVVSMAYFDFDYVPVEIKRLKFKNVVIPPRVVELKISRSGQHEVRFNYSGLGLRHSEGRLIFDEDSTC